MTPLPSWGEGGEGGEGRRNKIFEIFAPAGWKREQKPCYTCVTQNPDRNPSFGHNLRLLKLYTWVYELSRTTY